jgi:Domain of unknown function (DUF4157)
MQRASLPAQTETNATQEGGRAATPGSAQAQSSPAYSGNRAALRRLAAAYPNLQPNADQAMRTPTPVASLSAPPQISRKCAHCEEEEKATAVQPKLQRKENGTAPPLAPPQVERVLSAPGQPLDPATRAFMEPRFGHSFDQVRIHTGSQPAESARSIGALAYTVGRNIVFNQGRYSPRTPEGQRLLAHELTHVVQQNSAAVARRVQRDLIYGSDYKRPYSDDPTETKSSEAKTWYPATIDFTATASGSGGGSGSATFDDLIKTIAAKGKGSITSLGIIGHATTDLISLSGTITVSPADVKFTTGGIIDSGAIKAKMADITAVRDRFAAGAKIVLYGCHAGIGNSLMTALSSAFQVCVEGFSDEVWWCINWDLPARKINSRGRTFVDSAGMMGAGLLKPTCLGDFNADIRTLKPDKKDCTGVAAAPSAPGAKPNATDPQGAAPENAAPETATQQQAPEVQPKLEVNTPGDAFEQEADRVADHVMRMTDPSLASPTLTSNADPSTIQREETPVDVSATATEVEHLVLPGKDEKGALDKLKALDTAVLLKVVEQIYDDADATSTDEGKRRAYGLLNGDLAPPVAGAPASPGQSLSDDERARLKSAFDAAPTRKLRNPVGKDKGTDPTLSDSRKVSKPAGPVHPGDWGEDTGGNTWVAHAEGIRTYFGSDVVGDRRSSTWLGKNPSNFDYAPSLTKRASGSFHWGHGVHDFAIYLKEDDAGLDLQERMKPFSTMLAYIKVHLGNRASDKNASPEEYIQHMQRAVPVNEGDSPASWMADAAKWAKLIKGFKAAEGWNEGTTITPAKLKELSSDPKNAALVDYYQKLLGVTP